VPWHSDPHLDCCCLSCFGVHIQLIEQDIQKLLTVNQLTALSYDLSLPLIGRDNILFF